MKELEAGNGNLIAGVKGCQLIVSSIGESHDTYTGEDVTRKIFDDEKDEVSIEFHSIDSVDVFITQLVRIRNRLAQEELDMMQYFYEEVTNSLSEERKLDALVAFCNTGKFPDYA